MLRIVQGAAVTHPFGGPDLEEAEELQYRRRVVEAAAAALEAEVTEPTIFETAATP